MRILMLNHNIAWRGGTFVRAYQFARHLARRGHGVTLFAISPKARWMLHRNVIDGLNVVETPDLLWGRMRSGFDPWDTIRRMVFLRNERFDVIHAFDSRPVVSLPALFSRWIRGGVLVMDWADWWGRGGTIQERPTGPGARIVFGPIETYFEEAFRTKTDGTTVISSALFDRAVSLGVPADTILHLPQGSDVDAIRPLNRDKCRSELGLPKGVPLVGHMGALHLDDVKVLFDSFASLKRIRPDCLLLLLGYHGARITDREGIVETGFVPSNDLVKYLAACDVLILPLSDTIANRGRWPSRINDYLAAGRPVVASPVGDIRRIFENNRIGLLADSPDAMARSIVTLLVDSKLSSEMGLEARRVAERDLAWTVLTPKLEAYFLSLLKSRNCSETRS